MKEINTPTECVQPTCRGEVELINDHTICCTVCFEEAGYCTICGEWQPIDRLERRPMSVVQANGGYECQGRYRYDS